MILTFVRMTIPLSSSPK